MKVNQLIDRRAGMGGRIIRLKADMGARFKIEAVRQDGSVRLLADWFNNVITDTGLESIGSYINQLASCVVGSGGTAASTGDTALVAPVGETSTVQSYSVGTQPTAPYFGFLTLRYRFAAGVAAGNLAEVGINNSLGLFSRALILDGGGDPTTITVLPEEALDVTYQLRMYPPLSDAVGTVIVGGVTYDYVSRACGVTTGLWQLSTGLTGGIGGQSVQIQLYNGPIGADITLFPSGDARNASGQVQLDYAPGSHRRDGTFYWGLDAGNMDGGVKSALVSLGFGVTMGAMQVEFDPVIPKDETKEMSLTFRHSWARRTI